MFYTKTIKNNILLLILTLSTGNYSYALSNGLKSPSIFVDPQVWASFQSATPEQRAEYCRSDNKRAEKVLSLSWIPDKWPDRVEGYNSRMDNSKETFGAMDLDYLVKFLPGYVILNFSQNNIIGLQKAISVLENLADQSAFLKTKNCVDRSGVIKHCEMAWKQKDGQDLAPIKDYTTLQTGMAKIEWNYRGFLEKYADTSQQQKINSYFSEFRKRQRPYKKLWFGVHMGYLWNAVNDKKNPKKILENAIKELDKMVYVDGSLKNRTNRGDRALWYHMDGLNSTLVTMEMARRYGIAIPQSLINNVEKAAEVFLRGYKDHSFMDKWAKEGHLSVYRPGKQDFKNLIKDEDSGNSWFYIFMYRYPKSPLVEEIKEQLGGDFKMAIYDRKLGLGLGCIYGTVANLGSSTKTTLASKEKSQPIPITRQTEYQCDFEINKTGLDETKNSYGYKLAKGRFVRGPTNSISFGEVNWDSGKGDPQLLRNQYTLFVDDHGRFKGSLNVYGTRKSTKTLTLHASDGYSTELKNDEAFPVRGIHHFNVGKSKFSISIENCLR